jgi:hypothetical protein
LMASPPALQSNAVSSMAKAAASFVLSPMKKTCLADRHDPPGLSGFSKCSAQFFRRCRNEPVAGSRACFFVCHKRLFKSTGVLCIRARSLKTGDILQIVQYGRSACLIQSDKSRITDRHEIFLDKPKQLP